MQPIGEILGGYTMKKPKINELKENKKETISIRNMAKKTTKIKVTFNLDEDVVKKLKNLASDSGSKYQTLLNSILKEALFSRATYEERISNMEKELSEIKNFINKVA